MDAVILAAGRGSRLRPLTDTVPKPLVPVAGRGTLVRLLEILPPSVDRVILIVGYLEEKIRETVGDSFAGRSIVYVTQHPLDGTGGALRQAQSSLRSERFLVLNGDDLYGRSDLERLCEVERGVLVFRQKMIAPMDCWRVERGALVCFEKTPVGEIGNANINAMLLGQEWFETEPVLTPGKTDEWSMPHAFPQLFAHFSYRAIEATFWMPCGTVEEIARAEAAIL